MNGSATPMPLPGSMGLAEIPPPPGVAPAPRGAARRSGPPAALRALDYPRPFVRAAVWLSVFAIPFLRVYLPGTGERVGVTRLVQVLVALAVLAQPRACLRLLPLAVVGFWVYAGTRV